MAESIAIIDVDTHLTEPPDLWASRLPRKLRDLGPHVIFDETDGKEHWQVGRHTLRSGAAAPSQAGWKEFYPSRPRTFADADPGGHDPRVRLSVMDDHGIAVQILYPNLIGFYPYMFRDLGGELSLQCVRTFNDFQIEWCSEDPKRLIPLAFLPFWDLNASVVELKRCERMGYRGFNWGYSLEKMGLPPLRSEHWDPVMNLAQEFAMPVSFHIGFGSAEQTINEWASTYEEDLSLAQLAVLMFLGNATAITDLCLGGICERFPKLNFVSVESGFGYIPFLLDAMDWQYKNNRASLTRAGKPLPSEYFKRQVYATFWFEKDVGRLIDLLPDNVMFETDYPHPTSLSPGPGSAASNARATIAQNLGDVPDDIMRKILRDNAARIYHLDVE